MAVQAKPDVVTPKSTGAVKMPEQEKVTTEQPADNTSTGAVQMPGGPVETRIEHYDNPVTINYPTPTEPVTMSISWAGADSADGEETTVTKVIDAPARPAPEASPAPVETA